MKSAIFLWPESASEVLEKLSMENLLVEPTDTDLLQRAKGGDFAAFQQLIARLQPRVYGLTFRILQQAQDAEDATQQTFLNSCNIFNSSGSEPYATFARKTEITCEELLKALNDFVDGAELMEICEGFSQRLAGCNPCRVVVENICQTTSLYQSGQPYEMSKSFQKRLQQSLKSCWDEKFGCPTGFASSNG